MSGNCRCCKSGPRDSQFHTCRPLAKAGVDRVPIAACAFGPAQTQHAAAGEQQVDLLVDVDAHVNTFGAPASDVRPGEPRLRTGQPKARPGRVDKLAGRRGRCRTHAGFLVGRATGERQHDGSQAQPTCPHGSVHACIPPSRRNTHPPTVSQGPIRRPLCHSVRPSGVLDSQRTQSRPRRNPQGELNFPD